MKKIIEIDFDIKDIVYFTTDPMQDMYVVTDIIITEKEIMYTVCNTGSFKKAYAFELSKEKTIF